MPPSAYFVGSAVFHYLGPSFAVLLFARVEPLGVAWLRIASAAVIFAVWRRPWRFLRDRACCCAWGAGAGGDELLLLPGHRPAAARHRGRDRVPAGDRAGGARRAHAAQHRRARARGPGRVPAHRRAARGRAAGRRLRVRQRRCCSRSTSCSPTASRSSRASSGIDGLAASMLDRGRGRHAAGGLGGGAGVRRPGRAGGRRRRRRDLVGHPLRLRPAGDGAAGPRDLRAHGLAAARHGDRHRHRGAGPDPVAGSRSLGVALVVAGVAVHRDPAGAEPEPDASALAAQSG